MSLPAFKRLYPKDYIPQQLEGNVATALGPVLATPLLSYSQVQAMLVSGVPLNIAHMLGRQPVGWFVTDIDSYADVKRTAWSATTLTLEASADANVALWVF